MKYFVDLSLTVVDDEGNASVMDRYHLGEIKDGDAAYDLFHAARDAASMFGMDLTD